MSGSLPINPAWRNALTLVQGEITRNNIREIGNITRLWNEASREAQDIRNQTWQDGQRERDRLAESWALTMKGVASYYDPEDGTSAELSDGFERVWAKNGNEFLLTTDPTLDPNIEFREQVWNELKRTSP